MIRDAIEMKRYPQPIPYQGSKRKIADRILQYFPEKFDTLFEPFAGTAAISIAAAINGKASKFYLNDLNKPLIELLEEIVNEPSEIAMEYERIWRAQFNTEKIYDDIRFRFNKTHEPKYLLYLMARCVKGSVRYNSEGEFNQSSDKRRLGKNPTRMRNEIFLVSSALCGKAIFSSLDYTKILQFATSDDLVYLDPPYQGVCGNRDSRYFAKIHSASFVEELERLNERKIPFILSYDGSCGNKNYGAEIPNELNLIKISINAGRSAQATLLGRDEETVESLYLSPSLMAKIGGRIAMVNKSCQQSTIYGFE